MSDVIYYCTDPRQHEIYVFYKIKMLMSSMCRSSNRSGIGKNQNVSIIQLINSIIQLINLSKRVNNSTYHVHYNKIYLFWKINTAPCDYLSCHLFRFPVWSRCFYQLKKDLSDALLAAEHERNNFKAEVSFQTLFHGRPKLGVCFSFSLNTNDLLIALKYFHNNILQEFLLIKTLTPVTA